MKLFKDVFQILGVMILAFLIIGLTLAVPVGITYGLACLTQIALSGFNQQISFNSLWAIWAIVLITVAMFNGKITISKE